MAADDNTTTTDAGLIIPIDGDALVNFVHYVKGQADLPKTVEVIAPSSGRTLGHDEQLALLSSGKVSLKGKRSVIVVYGSQGKHRARMRPVSKGVKIKYVTAQHGDGQPAAAEAERPRHAVVPMTTDEEVQRRDELLAKVRTRRQSTA